VAGMTILNPATGSLPVVDDPLAHVGSLVRSARQHRGLTQTQLAERLGTSQSAVHRIEQGAQNVSLEMLTRIGAALDSPIVTLGGPQHTHLRVQGGIELHGRLDVNTSKNGAVALLCAFVALMAGTAAALGVFGRGIGTFVAATSALGEAYEIAADGVYAGSSRQLVAEGVGWDVFTLFVAVPLLAVAAAFVARRSFRGYLVAAGMLGYFLYMHLEYAVTWAFGPMFPLFVVTFGSSVVALVATATLIAKAGVRDRFDERFPRRRYAALNIAMALMLTALWIARIADGLAAETATLHGETTMTVQALDLGLVVPVSVLIAIAVLLRSPAATAAAAAFAVTFATMATAIAAMMVSAAIVTGALEAPPIVVFGLAGALGLALIARIYASAAPIGPSHALASGARPADLPAAG